MNLATSTLSIVLYKKLTLKQHLQHISHFMYPHLPKHTYHKNTYKSPYLKRLAWSLSHISLANCLFDTTFDHCSVFAFCYLISSLYTHTHISRILLILQFTFIFFPSFLARRNTKFLFQLDLWDACCTCMDI